MRVAVNDIDAEGAAETLDLLQSSGGQGLLATGDVADREAIGHVVADIEQTWGRLDVVVSNAGVIHSGTGLIETDDDEWNRTLAVHLWGCLNVTRASMPLLLRSTSARIILIGSLWGQRGEGHSYAYVSAKGAIAAFGRNLAVEYGAQGICVNVVAPGSVPTRMAADFSAADIELDCERIPMRRWGRAEEVSALVAFLASEASSYLTGQVISVNGGQVFGGT